MKIPLINLEAQQEAVGAEIEAAVHRVLRSRRFILGEEVAALEAEIASRVGAGQAVGVASGTDALVLALRAAGLGPGDEVLVPTFSFFATAGAVVNAGAVPVFVDIDPVDYCLDPGLAEEAVTERTRALLPVHLYGQCAAMDRLRRLAEEHDLLLIEDAAQALGADFEGRPAGSLGLAGCFSFFPTKNLGGAGDGGMITTSDAGLAARLRRLRGHGADEEYRHAVVGFNSRLDALQAAVLRAKLPHLEAWNRGRRRNARAYDERFQASGLGAPEPGAPIRTPPALAGRGHIFHQYVIRVERRDELRAFLAQRGIGTGVYYPLALHQQECFRELGSRSGAFEHAERASREVLALPVYPELTEAQIDTVVRETVRFYRG